MPATRGAIPSRRAHLTPAQFSTYTFQLPFAGGVLNPAAKVGYTQDYNFTVEQQLPGGIAMSLAYVGNHGVHIMSLRQLNPAVQVAGVFSTVANENARRLYAGLGQVTLIDSYEYAIYNALQLNVTRRVAKGLTLLSNITWSKSIDNGSDATELNPGPPNPLNTNSSRGPSDYDQKIRFNSAFNYITPRYTGGRIASALLNGYQANLISNLYTGFPFTVLSGTDRSLSGVGNDYADVVPASVPPVPPEPTASPNTSTPPPSRPPLSAPTATRGATACAARAMKTWTRPSSRTSSRKAASTASSARKPSTSSTTPTSPTPTRPSPRRQPWA